LDFARRPLKGQTSFVIGVGCNPGATDIDLEARRFEQKVNAGAEFVFSQPIYDLEILDRFLKKIAHVKPIPFFVGVLPLSSLKNAEFFNENVPGMQVPPEIIKRMAMGSSGRSSAAKGFKLPPKYSRNRRKHPLVQGAYIFPPFGHYERILDVLELSGVW
jgi:homocysteine S-methyltransferase